MFISTCCFSMVYTLKMGMEHCVSHRVKAPNVDELKALVHAISHRVVRFLEKRGFLERDADDCMDAGGRAPKVGASGDAWSSCREQLPGAGTG